MTRRTLQRRADRGCRTDAIASQVAASQPDVVGRIEDRPGPSAVPILEGLAHVDEIDPRHGVVWLTVAP